MVGVFVIFLVGFLTFIISPFAKNEIPQSFNSSRISASKLSHDIVFLLSATTKDIKNIQGNNKKSSEILEVVLNSIQKTKDARKKAVGLASLLEIMAVNVPKISPDEAKQTAIVAISSETALINKLISYNDGIVNLLYLLQKKYTGSENVSVDKINSVIKNINGDAEQISKFNSQFIDMMDKFDSYYKN